MKNDLKLARTIGAIRGNVEYLLEKLENNEIGGTGDFADIGTSGLRRALLDIQALTNQQREVLMED